MRVDTWDKMWGRGSGWMKGTKLVRVDKFYFSDLFCSLRIKRIVKNDNKKTNYLKIK